jgi:cytoskeletal protein CcmA (bactofilin family)
MAFSPQAIQGVQMAVQNPFFGKREPEAFQPRTPGSSVSGTSSVLNSTATTPSSSAASVAAASAAAAKDSSGGSKLTVGPNIKLKGVEITDCDTLVVEGTVEATMDSRVIQITKEGAFHGTAEIDVAEIHGLFDGTLTVREKLVIYSTGKVSGTIRYGKVVIEEGGQLTGEISVGTGPARSGASAPMRSDAAALAAA